MGVWVVGNGRLLEGAFIKCFTVSSVFAQATLRQEGIVGKLRAERSSPVELQEDTHDSQEGDQDRTTHVDEPHPPESLRPHTPSEGKILSRFLVKEPLTKMCGKNRYTYLG